MWPVEKACLGASSDLRDKTRRRSLLYANSPRHKFAIHPEHSVKTVHGYSRGIAGRRRFKQVPLKKLI
jgi:hypothetical protein